MYAVIFRAELGEFDDHYTATAARLRQRALEEYGCIEFTAVTEGNMEIAISWWEGLEQIQRWKQDPEHVAAQQMGRSKWYKSYTVQVVEILREYGGGL